MPVLSLRCTYSPQAVQSLPRHREHDKSLMLRSSSTHITVILYCLATDPTARRGDAIRTLIHASLLLFVGLVSTGATFAQKSYTLREVFDDKTAYRVELRTNIAGEVTVASAESQAPQPVAMQGKSQIVYDERPLPSDDVAIKKSIRSYSLVEFSRTFGDNPQKASIREGVRRMVVLRADTGRKAPFSPDGALTYGEIDIVKNDLFSPTLVPGLLPDKDVALGEVWKVSPAAVMDLTDLDSIDEGELTIEFLAVVTVNNREQAKLGLRGTVRGKNEDGPNRQKLDGTAYFDLVRNRLNYLKVTGVQEMLNADGKPTGKIEGTFVMAREEAAGARNLAVEALAKLDLVPGDQNTLLLYENAESGLQLLYPRRWRLGTVQPLQLTLQERSGASILLTVLPTERTPTLKQFQADVKTALLKQKLEVTAFTDLATEKKSPTVDRFSCQVSTTGQPGDQLEYALIRLPQGTIAMTARLPKTTRKELAADVTQVLERVSLTKVAIKR